MKIKEYPDISPFYVYHMARRIPARNRTISISTFSRGNRRLDYFYLAFPELIFYQRFTPKTTPELYAFIESKGYFHPFPFCNISPEGNVCTPIKLKFDLNENIAMFWNTSFTLSYPSWVCAWDCCEVFESLGKWSNKTRENPDFMKSGYSQGEGIPVLPYYPIDDSFEASIRRLLRGDA